MRYAITVEYDGTRYSGWQRQLNAVSVQEVLEAALGAFLGEKTVLHASGRTDRGVHAAGQVAHFDTECTIPPHKIRFAVNSALPDDVRIVDMRHVGDGFHAQYDVVSKTYSYKIYVGNTLSPLRRLYYTRVLPPLDTDAMRRAAAKLVGTHDFRAFSSTGSSAKTSVRTLYEVNVETDGDEVVLTVTGNGFLYNMVRIIAGTLVFIGKGKIPEENVDLMLSTGERKLGGKTFPACALTLEKVEYPD